MDSADLITGAAGFTALALVIALLLQIFEWASASAAFLGLVVLLLLAGVLTGEEAFGGFSNAAPLTIAALYVITRGIERTGLTVRVVQRLAGNGVRQRETLARICVPAAGLSAFINNTPLVATLAPPLASWAQARGLPPSRVLMPLSYAVILGGLMTTIGTSTNLVVSGLLEGMGQAPFSFFEMSPVGVPVALAGLVLIVALSPIVLPERKAARQEIEEGVREYLLTMRIVGGGPLDGKTIARAGLRHLRGVFLFGIERGGQIIAPVTPETGLAGDDLLFFAGQVDTIVDLQAMPGLVSDEAKHVLEPHDGPTALFEVVVASGSPLVGRTLRGIGFRGHYQAAVLAIHRAGAREHSKLGDVKLAFGDTLLLLADPGFADRWRNRRDFLVISRLYGTAPIEGRHSTRMAIICALVWGAAAFDIVPILYAAMAGALACVALGVMTAAEAVDSIDLDVFIVVASSFAVAVALQKTGLAELIATELVRLFGTTAPYGAIVGIVLATSILTELLTNSAAAAIMLPIAVATATSVGLDVRAIAVAVAVVSSASFMSPIGYQTNTMVFGLGGYKFLDFARLGAPLTLTSLALTVWLTLR